MPSFYQPQRPPPFGYSASDYESHNIHSQFPGYPDHSQAYGLHFASEPGDISRLYSNNFDQYKNASGYASVGGYEQRTDYATSANGRPMVPPLRTNDFSLQQNGYKRNQQTGRSSNHYSHAHRHQQQQQQQQQQNKEEEKPSGGVSAKLDYNMDEMTDFVVEMAITIISPSSFNADTYRKWVHQVLNATRLPSATILLSLSYMTLRVRSLTVARRFDPSEYSLYEYLTVALILGSKFLDDNTFQNKSWAEVSNIKVGVLNKEEMHWLSSFGHRLHHDPHQQDGFASWEYRWNSYKAKSAPNSGGASLQAHESGLDRRPPLRSPAPAAHYHPQYPVSAMSSIHLDSEPQQTHFGPINHSPYDAWFPQHSTAERSPSTAPHTGPNTPEFYAGHGGWHPYDAFQSRPRPSAYGNNIPLNSNFETYPPAFDHLGMNYAPNNVWNCHGAACQCASCRQTHVPRYGPIIVG